MEHLGDVGHVESRFRPFGDNVSDRVRLVHGLHQTYHRLRTRFGHTQWYFMLMRLKWKLDSICLEIVLIFVQDGCTVWSNVPQAQKSFWTHLMELLGDVGHVESHFSLFGDSASVGAR